MNATRKLAQAKYDAALKVLRAAENGADEQVWIDADVGLSIARQELIAAEEQYPTPAETKRSNNLLRLRNRGLDV